MTLAMEKRDRFNHHDVLVVEDSPTQLEQLRHLLEDNGYSVRTAANGKEALAEALQRPPAIIISDIVMPEMDGYALCRAVRSEELIKNVPIVLMTSLTGPREVIEALKSGADNFIRKPYDERHLLIRIDNILTTRKLREASTVKVGVELQLAGQRHFITAEKQQILDLLISTYEQAVQLCADLQVREQRLERANKILDGIYRIAKGLNSATTQQEVIALVLDRVLEMPDVRAGWLSLWDDKSGFRLAAARGLPPAFEGPGFLDGDCTCRRKVLAGEIERAANISECERLQRIVDAKLNLRSHATIPLRTAGRLLGILNLVGTEEVLFDRNDLTVLNGIGNQIGAALERCRIHEHLEFLVHERTIKLKAEVEERRALEAQLIQVQKMETIGALAGGIAHDFNNLLGIIMGHAGVLERIKSAPPELQPSLDAINRAVERGAGLVRQLMTFARKTDAETQAVAVNAIIEELIKMLKQAFPRTITLETALDRSVPLLQADPNQMHQAFLNLAVNARDAMPDGGILEFRTSVRNGADLKPKFPDAQDLRYVCIEVADNGMGIEESIQGRIFDPFFTTKEFGKGTGLGMSVVYGVVRAHQGFIDLTSAIGHGTTFRLYFPVTEIPASAEDRNDRGSAEPVGGTETILVVEDEPLLRELVVVLLGTMGYQVLIAADGEEAINVYRARKDQIDLVLTDVGLPLRDGLTVVTTIKTLNAQAKIILASGYIEPAKKSAMFQAGVKDIIQKPYNASEVLTKVRAVLDGQ